MSPWHCSEVVSCSDGESLIYMFKDVNRAATVWATHLTLKETIYPQVNSSINRDIITSLARSGEGSFIKGSRQNCPSVPRTQWSWLFKAAKHEWIGGRGPCLVTLPAIFRKTARPFLTFWRINFSVLILVWPAWTPNLLRLTKTKKNYVLELNQLWNGEDMCPVPLISFKCNSNSCKSFR